MNIYFFDLFYFNPEVNFLPNVSFIYYFKFNKFVHFKFNKEELD